MHKRFCLHLVTFGWIGLQAFGAAAERVETPTGADNPPWGVYTWGERGGAGVRWPIRGEPLTWHWPRLEPERGHYAFDREIREPLEKRRAAGLYTHLMLWIAPDTPAWVYAAGVPKVEVPERMAPSRKRQRPTYPYYFDPKFQDILHATVKALGDYLAGLPADLKSRIVFIQVAEGSTGDGQPYKGVPLKPEFRITKDAWNEYRRKTWAFYQSVFQRADGSLAVPILVNGDANEAAENAWLIEHCDAFGVKQGMFSHGYLVSDTVDRLARWRAFRAEARAKGRQVFTRGEEDEEWRVCGWCAKNPPQALYWSALFALHCGLDIWNVPTDALTTQPLGETVQFFNRYAGHDDAAQSPNAFCALRRGLDASDASAFPAGKFGPLERSNQARYLAIAAAYAPYGARQGDPAKALGGGMLNRQADDQNDVGWGIWPGNFERFLTQVDPELTSLALWHVEPAKHPYSLFARRFDAASGRSQMKFRLDDAFFSGRGTPHAVRLRIVYLDRGAGQWQLAYATGAGMRVARTVNVGDTGEWRGIDIELPDAMWDHRLEGGDFVLRQIGTRDTVFHLVELERR